MYVENPQTRTVTCWTDTVNGANIRYFYDSDRRLTKMERTVMIYAGVSMPEDSVIIKRPSAGVFNLNHNDSREVAEVETLSGGRYSVKIRRADIIPELYSYHIYCDQSRNIDSSLWNWNQGVFTSRYYYSSRHYYNAGKNVAYQIIDNSGEYSNRYDSSYYIIARESNADNGLYQYITGLLGTDLWWLNFYRRPMERQTVFYQPRDILSAFTDYQFLYGSPMLEVRSSKVTKFYDTRLPQSAAVNSVWLFNNSFDPQNRLTAVEGVLNGKLIYKSSITYY
ncbi:MAG: hypothetical protein KA821_17600 [Chitinophagaceae bacterium]|nr:hypothetical protein [Chitinophagaceae bacterium]